jgi:hypothetical protein
MEVSQFDFGDIKQFEIHKHLFKVTNSGSSKIEITGVTKSCGCTKVEVETTKLEPGQSTALTVEINPADRIGKMESKLQIQWKYVENDFNGTRPLTLKANVVVPIRTYPSFIEFGEIAKNKKPIAKTIMIWRGESKVPWDDLKMRNRLFDASYVMLSPNTYTLTVQLDPKNYPVGTINDQIEIALYQNGKPVEGQKSFFIPITARITGDLDAVPESIYLGVIPTSGPQEGFFRIKTTNRTYKFTSVTSTAPGILKANLVSSDSNGFLFKYNFSIPDVEGNIYGKFTALFKDDSSEERIVIPLIGFYHKQ